MARHRAVLVVAGLALGLVVGEVGVRALLPRFSPAGGLRFVDGPVPGLAFGPPGQTLRHFKNTGDYDVPVTFNRHGLRDRRDIADARPGDVVFVGDSFTFGWGVREDERFSNVYESLTGRRAFNLAVPAGLEGYAALLAMARDQGARIDRLVLGVCMENDLRLEVEAPGAASGVATVREGIKAWLTDESALYIAASTAVHQTPALRTVAGRLGLLAGPLGENTAPTPAQVDAAVALTAQLIEPYAATVTLIPSRGLWVGADTAAWRDAHRRFVSALAARRVDVLDLRPAVEAGGNPLQYYFRSDGHWNAAGHRLAGQALATHRGSPQ